MALLKYCILQYIPSFALYLIEYMLNNILEYSHETTTMCYI